MKLPKLLKTVLVVFSIFYSSIVEDERDMKAEP